MAEKFKMIVAVHLFLARNDFVLLLRRFNTGWKDGYFSTIAGHVDGGETIASAMAREAKEEADIDIKEDDLALMHTMHRTTDTGVERIDFFFEPKSWSGEPLNAEPDKCDDLRWCALDQLPENTVPYIRSAIKDIQKGVTFSEFDERT